MLGRVGTDVPQTRALNMNTLTNGTQQRFPTFFQEQSKYLAIFHGIFEISRRI
jgi:hypothetical protein